jgi:uncharacterized protein YndB with AHSA1/START domain/DNA-binding transcriptional ArsR family regulator
MNAPTPLDQVFAALSSPTRRAILDRLRAGEATVADLAAPFALTQPTISAHLRVLEEAGLVTRGRAANTRPVRLAPGALQDAHRWLTGHAAFWDGALGRLEDHAQTLQAEKNDMETRETEADRTAVIRRRMAVPARNLFAAHAEGRHIMRWFGPPGYPVTQCDYDFRVGGRWRMVMTGPDGIEGPPFGGEFLEIVPDRRIVYTDAFEDGRGGAMNLAHARSPMVFTVTFDPQGEHTLVTLSVLFASVAMKDEFLGIGMLDGLTATAGQWEGVARGLVA